MIISNHRRRKKKEGDEDDEDDEKVFHLVSYKWFRRTRNITELGGDYKEVGVTWRLSDCEELSGGYLECV